MRYLFLFRIVLTIIFVSVLANKGYCQQKPNIIFILADDLGSSELGCYGQTKIQTPHINRLAAQGMKFTKFYAGNNVCAPSRCSLLTGKHPGHATIRDNREDKPEGQQPLLASDVTLASLLKKQGYTTAAIGKWGLGMFGTTGDPLRHGFDSFFGYNCQRHAHSHYPAYLYRNDTRFALPGNLRHTGTVHSHDLLDVEAEKFLRENATKPFFLFLPVTLPHVAVQVPERDLEQYVGKFGDDPPYDGKKGYFPHPQPRTGYAAMVSKIDRTVGK
ncbi:MAG TPA: sulfatase-like hydrolase/transferase, partial [Gemmatales bacterium]|nr:sulfatase-like hydrolase/transferase [Gemmatales bacterium]